MMLSLINRKLYRQLQHLKKWSTDKETLPYIKYNPQYKKIKTILGSSIGSENLFSSIESRYLRIFFMSYFSLLSATLDFCIGALYFYENNFSFRANSTTGWRNYSAHCFLFYIPLLSPSLYSSEDKENIVNQIDILYDSTRKTLNKYTQQFVPSMYTTEKKLTDLKKWLSDDKYTLSLQNNPIYKEVVDIRNEFLFLGPTGSQDLISWVAKLNYNLKVISVLSVLCAFLGIAICNEQPWLERYAPNRRRYGPMLSLLTFASLVYWERCETRIAKKIDNLHRVTEKALYTSVSKNTLGTVTADVLGFPLKKQVLHSLIPKSR